MIKSLLIRGSLRILSWLPIGIARWMGKAAGSLLWFTGSRMAQTTRINIALCFPGLTPSEQDNLAKRSVQETCKTVFESGAVWLWPSDKVLNKIRKVRDQPLLKNVKKSARGLIVLAPHHGNWEVLGLYLVKHYPTPCHFLYQPPKEPAMDALLQSSRCRSGGKLIPTTPRGIAELVRCLRQGELTGILPDQVPAENSGAFAPFFGQQALTMTLLARLIEKTGCDVVLGYTKRVQDEKGAGFEIVFKEMDNRFWSSDVKESLIGLNASIEEVVNDDPALYQWDYKRFRRQPEGVKRPY